MPALTSTGTELRRFRGGLLPTVAIVALVLIPLLYGALYLWAFWDPTGRMEHLPVALVDADRPTTLADGTPVHAGEEVTQRLVDDGSLDWVTTDAEDAKDGVANGRYYFAVTLPADFSAAVASAAGEHPQQARIHVTYDDGNSFLADTLGHSAMVAVDDAVRATLSDKAVETLLVGLGTTRDGLTTAADGAVTLEQAASQLADGAAQVASGADDAAAGAGRLATGADAAAGGAAQLSTGARSAATGAAQVATGARSAADGAAQVATGARSAADGAAQVATGARSAADGAAQLATGARSAADGATQLATGSAALDDGLGAAATGAATLDAGAARLAAGVDQAVGQISATADTLATAKPALADVATYLTGRARAGDAAAATALTELSGVAQGLGTVDTAALGTQLTALHDGAHQVATGAAQLDTALGRLHDGSTTLATGAHALADGTSTLADGSQTLAAGTGTLATGAGALADGTATLATGAASLAGGTSALAGGASTLAQGTATLSGGAATLATGTSTLADGSRTLAAGTGTLAAGAHQVADGGGQIADGAGTLATGLSDGAARIPADDDSLRRARGEVISTPVALDEQHAVQAEGFGEGFAPFFISLALFVGALITWLLLRPLPTRALASPASGLRTTMAGFLPAAILAVGQVAVMMTVLKLGLHLDMATVAGTLGLTLLVALAFVALQQMLTALLGSAAGKVTILALLMLQLASSGGTYPVETTPAFFRAIHPVLPMTYAVTGLREVITGGADARLWGSVAVLVGVLVGSLAVTAWRAGRMRTWTLSRLHPALAL